MQRRSKRLRTAPKGYIVDPVTSDSEGSDSPDRKGAVNYAGKRKVKRVAKRASTTRGKRGKLEKMSDLPLDILFEIFAELEPMDILNLSRTSKPLRDILLRRSSIYVWKSALARVKGLPECPSDMSEPAYTNLVFYPYCHYCSEARVTSKAIMWALRARCCKECFPENFEPFDGHSFSMDLIPICRMFTTSKRYKEFIVNIHTLRQYRAEKDELKGPELGLWYSSKRAARDAQHKHAMQCEQWNQTQSENRSNELENIRQQRLEAIKGKLTELGWEQEIEFVEDYDTYFEEGPLSEHKLVRQPKALTERIWNNIKDSLVELMERARAARLEIEFSATIKTRSEVLAGVLDTYASSQPLHTILPPLADVAILPPFKVVIQDTPAAEEVTALHFQKAMTNFSQAVTKWRQSTDESLVKLINCHPATEVKVTTTILRDPATFFHCLQCLGSISYPRILVHRCTTTIQWRDVITDQYFRDIDCKPWNYRDAVVEYDSDNFTKARFILRDCSLDVTDHNLKNLRFECLKCRSPRDGRLLMKWPIAVEHVSSWHHITSATASGLIQVANLSLAEQILAELLEYNKMNPASEHKCHAYSWVCLECKKVVPWPKSLKHLKEKHPNNIPVDFTEDQHGKTPDRSFTLHLDADRTILCAPIKVNVDDPIHGFRDSLETYHHLRLMGELDSRSQQMADNFTTVLALAQNTKEAAARPG